MVSAAKFEEERALTEALTQALALRPCSFLDPHADGKPECGIDVLVTAGGQLYGVQVTVPGDRAEEAKIAKAASADHDGVYFMWANANSHVAYKDFAAAIARKAAIAERHNFTPYDEAWLLMVAGIPKLPGAVSTLLPPWFDVEELTTWTRRALAAVKYHRVYILAVLDVRPRLLMWTRDDKRWIDLVNEPTAKA
jgi:hypothetical protein